MFGDTSNQGTLIAFASFSQDKMLNMLRSAALLSPIAYMGQMSSFLARSAADLFLAEVRIRNPFSNLQVLVFMFLHDISPAHAQFTFCCCRN